MSALDKAVADLEAITTGDNEAMHIMADEILLKYLENNGLKPLADAWNKLDRESGGFWYA